MYIYIIKYIKCIRTWYGVQHEVRLTPADLATIDIDEERAARHSFRYSGRRQPPTMMYVGRSTMTAAAVTVGAGRIRGRVISPDRGTTRAR